MLGSRHLEARSYRGMATVFLVFLRCPGLSVGLFQLVICLCDTSKNYGMKNKFK